MAALIKKKKQALAKKLATERKDRPMNQGQQRTYMRQFVKNQSCVVYSTGWSMPRMKSFTDDQLKEEFEKIQKAISNIHIQAFSRSLRRTGPVLEEPSSKRQMSTTAPIPSVPEVPQSPVVVSDEDSEDEAPHLWSAFVGWEVLFDSYEGDVSYPLSVKLIERMLRHKLEIDKDVVVNDMTTAEQLIRFIKNQLTAAHVSTA
nr:hypothetical protein [Tanacetum cinerariifolium]